MDGNSWRPKLWIDAFASKNTAVTFAQTDAPSAMRALNALMMLIIRQAICVPLPISITDGPCDDRCIDCLENVISNYSIIAMIIVIKNNERPS
jgi:hypothetical protein